MVEVVPVKMTQSCLVTTSTHQPKLVKAFAAVQPRGVGEEEVLLCIQNDSLKSKKRTWAHSCLAMSADLSLVVEACRVASLFEAVVAVTQADTWLELVRANPSLVDPSPDPP